MKILVFTTLFPNKLMPQHGLFIKARVAALAKKHEVRVVARHVQDHEIVIGNPAKVLRVRRASPDR